jgi:uncharacterized protein (DUF927 family)
MMNTKEFLTTVLSDEGYYCVAGIKNGKIKTKFYTSLDAAIETANNFDLEKHDAYFALGSFVDGTNRKAENVRDLKALFLDLDCGEGKPYKTQQEALLALKDWYKKYDIPRPTVVNSGRGLHAYWSLDRAYTREEWLPVATSLKASCLQDGLEIDPAVTSDAARILRIPNTHNFKDEPPTEVRIVSPAKGPVVLAEFAAKLPTDLIPVLCPRDYSSADKSDMDNAKGNESKYTYKFANILLKTAQGSGCAHIDKAIRKPDELSYPEWTHALSIAKRCDTDGVVGGLPAIHLISKGYSEYSADETEKIAASIEFPHLCTTFNNDCPGLCDGCPNNGKIKSPITLCRELKLAESDEVEVQGYAEVDEGFYDERADEVPVESPDAESVEVQEGVQDTKPKKESVLEKIKIPTYPDKYVRPEGGGVAKVMHDKEGNREEVIICPDNLYVKKRMADIEGPCYEIAHTSKYEGERTFVASQKELMSAESFRAKLNSNDVLVLPSSQKDLMEYIASWIIKLKESGPPIQVKSQFGWTENCKSFVLGDKEIFGNRIEHNPAGSRTAQYVHMFDKKGTLEEWKNLARFYNKPGFEQHQYMFGLSFGSPLMEFVSGISGCIYNLNSPETGIGKTTGMWGGASVWGNHKKLVIVGKDTPNSAWNRAEVGKNLPLYIDEVSNYKPEPASDFCYAISDGVQKNRMSNKGENAERFRGEPWSLNCGTTGNSSLTDIAGQYRSSPKGESGRVVAATATRLLHGPKDTLEANDLNDQLAENYGHAGPLYIQHVIKNKVAVKELLADTRTKLIKVLNAEPQERFWIAQAATVHTGCTIAKELGLIDWDLDKLWKWILKLIKAQRANLKGMDMDIEDLISQFYMDNARSILRINSTASNTDPELQNIIPINMQDMPNYRFVARHELDTSKLFIRIPPFKQWLAERKYTWSSVKALIYARMEGKSTKKRMGAGTKMDIGVTAVIECTLNIDPTVRAEDSDEVEA